MAAFGAELRIVPSDGGKVTPALFDRFREGDRDARGASRTRSGRISSTTRTRSTATPTIGRELLEQTGGRLDVFCGAVGTGGMLARRGARAARRRQPRPHRRARAGESPAMTAGRGGAHRVEGIATGSIPPHMTAQPLPRGARDSPRPTRARWRTPRARRRTARRHVQRPEHRRRRSQLASELGPGKVVATVAVDYRAEVSRRRSVHRAVNCRRTCAMNSLRFGARHTCAH